MTEKKLIDIGLEVGVVEVDQHVASRDNAVDVNIDFTNDARKFGAD